MAYAPCNYLDLPDGTIFRKGNYHACRGPMPQLDLSQFPWPIQKNWQFKEFRSVLQKPTGSHLGMVCKDDCAKCPCYSPRAKSGVE